jgi:hypothetical protein
LACRPARLNPSPNSQDLSQAEAHQRKYTQLVSAKARRATGVANAMVDGISVADLANQRFGHFYFCHLNPIRAFTFLPLSILFGRFLPITTNPRLQREELETCMGIDIY